MQINLVILLLMVFLSSSVEAKPKGISLSNPEKFCQVKSNRTACCKMKYVDDRDFFECVLANMEYKLGLKFSKQVKNQKMIDVANKLNTPKIYPWIEHDLNPYRMRECEHEKGRDVRRVLSCLIRDGYMHRAMEIYAGVDEKKVPKTWKIDICLRIQVAIVDKDLTREEAVERLGRLGIGFNEEGECKVIWEHH